VNLLAVITAILSAAIAAGSLVVAYFQFRVSRSRARSERERIEAQKERLRFAASSSASSAAAADLIVQRAKDDSVSKDELQNLARILRGSLLILTKQLQADEKNLARWQVGVSFESDFTNYEQETRSDG
jgi:hypothetical protein